MFFLQITEIRMRVEIKDEAARLRLQRTEIRCVKVTEREFNQVVPPCCFDAERECPDCGGCIICCRCGAGEG